MDPIQIPLPPSETGSVRENEPVNHLGVAPPLSELTEDADEIEKRLQAENFLQEVAWDDPYIPNPYLIPTASIENVDEERKPTRTESWERMLKEVSRHDEDMVKGWRDDIDTLLVFAGLFSAVVTAFVIESYQWLDEDPTDTTVTLLTQLISVQVNGSQPTSFERTQFKPDVSSIRINVFWFLSLILSLTSALFGLLCKQWIREHQRDTTTRTPGEALALRQLRRDSFEEWGVSSFLSALPILLEVALLLFFVGVLDLLWNRHPVPFAICFVAVALSVGLYFLTTLLPTLAVPRDQRDDIKSRHFNQLSYQSICPYKSPQAWMVYRLSSVFLRPLLKVPAINDFLRQKARRFWDHIKSPAPDWSSLDLWVVRQFDERVPGFSDYLVTPPLILKVYELHAFEWAVAMFRDSPSMLPHLQNVLETTPNSVAMSAILGRWDHTMWKTVSNWDIEATFRHPDPNIWDPPNSTIRHAVLQRPEGINLLFHHQYWAKVVGHLSSGESTLKELIDSIKIVDLQHSTGLRFVIPFSVVDALWTHEDPIIRVKSLALLSFFEESWKSCPGYDEGRHDDERRAFMEAPANHINRTDRVSVLLTSKRGQAFIRFIHNQGITRRLLHHIFSTYAWPMAIKKAQEVGGLPSDYFTPILEPWENDPPTLPDPDPVRYSVDTERFNDSVLDIVTSNGTEDTSGVGPLKDLALRQLRRDSFEKWGVSSFLSALPILLEVALLFFFVGVLDLLWNRHLIPFAICFVAVALSVGLYFLTTLLPTLAVPRDQRDDIRFKQFNQLSYQSICPYKSPQAWMVYRLSNVLLRPLLKVPAINDFLRQKARRFWDHIKSPASDWSSLDLWVTRQFDQPVWLPPGLGIFTLKVYELCAFEWAVTMFRDSPSMIPHLQNILGTVPPSVAMSAILGRWDRTMWNTVSNRDVELTLKFPDPNIWDPPNPITRHPVLQHPEGISLLSHHQYWAKVAADRSLGGYTLDTLIDSMKSADLQHSTGLRFVIPFSVVDALWTHQDPITRAESLVLLSLFEESWKPCPGYDEGRHDDERRAFMEALANHINRTDRVSVLLTSKRGHAFIRFIHNQSINRRLFRHSLTMYAWPTAIKKAQEVGGLPSDYFTPVPESWENHPPTLPDPDPVRYSIDTERNNDVVLDIVTSNGMENTFGVGPLKDGLIHRLHNIGARLVTRRWLSLFSSDREVTHNDINDNTILGSRIADSPDEMSDIASREPGEGHEDNLQNLGRDEDSGPRQRTDTGILDNPGGQVDEAGDSYRLRRQGSRVDAIAQPMHDQESLDEDRIDTGNSIEQGDDGYRLNR